VNPFEGSLKSWSFKYTWIYKLLVSIALDFRNKNFTPFFFFLQEWLLPKVKSKIAINHSRPFNGWIADAKDFNKIKKKYLLSMN
jgi:hypothetical protein